jgi:hypothetical protein
MRWPRWVVAFAAAIPLAGPAFGEAAVVPPNRLDYGSGRIDASAAYEHIGQMVVACGRAAQPFGRATFFLMGVSPYETVVAFPPGTDPSQVMPYSFKMVCVSGRVEVGTLYMGLGRATIALQDPSQQIELIGDVPPYRPRR